MLWYGITPPSIAMRIVLALPMVLVALFWVFGMWAWRWPIVLRLVGRPWLGGTWVGVIEAGRLDGGSSEGATVVVRIKQTFVSVSMVMMTADSMSRTRVVSILTNDRHDYTLTYRYDSRPAPGRGERGGSYQAWADVDVHGARPERLAGDFWTDRREVGTFAIRLVSRRQVDTFEEGRALVEAKGLALPVGPGRAQPTGPSTRST